METLVTGEVVLPEASESFSNATVYIRLEDVSRIDAKSVIVAEEVLRSVSIDASEKTSIAFSIQGELPTQTADYIVTVHVDANNDGKRNKGDFITTETIPVLTHGYPNDVVIHVVQI